MQINYIQILNKIVLNISYFLEIIFLLPLFYPKNISHQYKLFSMKLLKMPENIHRCAPLIIQVIYVMYCITNQLYSNSDRANYHVQYTYVYTNLSLAIHYFRRI
jgi:hypothetical protein